MRNRLSAFLLSLFFLFTNQLLATFQEPHFVIIIPSYNNEKWVKQNISSCISQSYPYWRLIYIDDCSSDKTAKLANAYVQEYNLSDRCTIIKNRERQGALANIYNAVASCDPKEIIVTVDGDDFLTHTHVLDVLASYYRDPNVWMTYGNFITNHPNWKTCCDYIPRAVSRKNEFRSYKWVSSHLRTFYAKLFHLISQDDLMWKGKFFPMTWDMAFMFPMLEMCARDHFRFIPEALYLYNVQNPLNDYRVNAQLQRDLEKYIRQMKPYKPLKNLF